jgi:hypothetical protein
MSQENVAPQCLPKNMLGARTHARSDFTSGRGGIRTPETGVARLTVFKTVAWEPKRPGMLAFRHGGGDAEGDSGCFACRIEMPTPLPPRFDTAREPPSSDARERQPCWAL